VKSENKKCNKNQKTFKNPKRSHAVMLSGFATTKRWKRGWISRFHYLFLWWPLPTNPYLPKIFGVCKVFGLVVLEYLSDREFANQDWIEWPTDREFANQDWFTTPTTRRVVKSSRRDFPGLPIGILLTPLGNPEHIVTSLTSQLGPDRGDTVTLTHISQHNTWNVTTYTRTHEHIWISPFIMGHRQQRNVKISKNSGKSWRYEWKLCTNLPHIPQLDRCRQVETEEEQDRKRQKKQDRQTRNK